MSVETRTALLVGLVIIILFGLVLGQRSLQVSNVGAAEGAGGMMPPPRPGGEVMNPRVDEGGGGAALPQHRPRSLVLAARSGAPGQRPATPQAPRQGQAGGRYTEVTLNGLVKRFNSTGRMRTYVVRRGDNLTRIARREMGDGGRGAVKRLYEANRDRIKNPNCLSVGQELRIPG